MPERHSRFCCGTRFCLQSLLIMLCFVCANSWSAPTKPKVLVSIPPLALMVDTLFQGDVEVVSLLKEDESPHHFSMDFAKLSALKNADIVIWVGPQLESSLAKAIKKADVVISLAESAELDSDGLDSHHHQANHGHHHHHETDSHIWLSPKKIIAMASAILADEHLKQWLSLARREALLAEFELQILAASSEIKRQLAPFKTTPFGVYHDGYSHFVHEFELNQLAALKLIPEQKLSAKQLLDAKRQLRDAKCLMVDRGEAKFAEKLARKLSVRLVPTALLAGQQRYASMADYLKGVAADFTRCLSDSQVAATR